MLCELLSVFSQPVLSVLPLPCDVYISVTLERRHGDGVMLSQLPDAMLL